MLAKDYLAAAAVDLADRTLAVCFMPRLSEAQPFGVEANRTAYVGDEEDGACVPRVCDLFLARAVAIVVVIAIVFKAPFGSSESVPLAAT